MSVAVSLLHFPHGELRGDLAIGLFRRTVGEQRLASSCVSSVRPLDTL